MKELMVFSKDWFIKHQTKLVFLLKFKTFQKLLGIDSISSDGYNKNIVKLMPNSVTWKNDGDTYTIEFKINNKYSYKLYKSFIFVWKLMHLWDELFADKYLPQLSFGFSTLTEYPDTGEATTNNTHDATISRNLVGTALKETLVDITSSERNEVFNSVSTISLIYAASIGPSDGSDTRYKVYSNAQILFDTSDIRVNHTISSAILSLYSYGGQDDFGIDYKMNVYKANPFVNYKATLSDYNAMESVKLCDTDVGTTDWIANGSNYYDITLNTEGINSIKRGTISDGITKFGFKNPTYEVAQVNYTGETSDPSPASYNYVYFISLASDNGSLEPKLTVTYSYVPGSITGNLPTFFREYN